MKMTRYTKCLFLAVLAAFVSASGAATLNWNVASVRTTAGDQFAEDYLGYLFIESQSSDFGALTASVDTIKNLIQQRGDLSPYIAFAAKTKTGSLSGSTDYNSKAFKAGDSLTGFVVVFDSSSYENATHFMVTATKSVTFTTSTGGRPLAFGSQAGATWIPIAAVPEPATGTLMIISGAALIVGRRRRHD